jgi:hypothetical protein
MEAPAVVLPEFLPEATSAVDSALPTMEAAIAVPGQSASGVEVTLERVWQEGKSLHGDLCFTVPDSGDWSVWAATLQSGDLEVREFGAALVSLKEPSADEPGLRCDTLTFLVPPDADLRSGTITIESIAAYPREDEYCSVYMPKIQQALQERGIAITLECEDVNGSATMRIVNWPAEMTEEQAQEVVFDDEFYSVQGPWAFAFNLGQ